MLILDSNVWIAYLNKDDSLHPKAQKTLQPIIEKDQQIILPEYIILEICSILLIKVNKLSADNFLNFVLNNQNIKILYSDVVFFTKLVSFFKNQTSKQLSFVDIALLYLSKSYPVITFDKKLEKAILLFK